MNNNEQKVIDLYLNNKNMGIKNIGKQLNMCPKTIKKIFIRNNIKIKPSSFVCRKYDVNDYFLDKIKKEQAYFLGWIASDGSVGKNNEVTLALQDRDKDVIEKIKYLLNFDGPIKFLNTKNKIKTGGIKSKHNAYRISIANERIANKLRKLNFNEKKSYNLEFPKFLNKKLIPHFLRSFIEGDGSIIYVKKSNNLYISFASTTRFCLECKSFIEKTLGINVFVGSVLDNYNKNKKISTTHSRLIINGNGNSLVFLNYIYKNAFLYMNRKYEYFKNVINILDNRPQMHIRTKNLLKISKQIIINNTKLPI